MSDGALEAPPGGARLVAWYAAFAAISIVANLGSQKIALCLYRGPYTVALSVCVGTAVGLVVKYVLDKSHIFRHEDRSLGHGIRTFVLYVVMGIGTTFVFWIFEFGADAIFHTEAARFMGGAIGLTAGYFTKYQLDKRFVFA
ncbi:conserved membrane hypothetical protein [Paraburkholderia piptadeniae]|uniref:Uncharacterized protein n=1 Tax=Paraburkholderia piptadeniae TaxID=1701573 RepID=A0A1N7S8E2_9BURK|nr:GtrA family protein [Paraburkholderia piptadeniae]SIT43590.1 conserved membrane hypothetical protein [Paraburkholderia piptadeniae]